MIIFKSLWRQKPLLKSQKCRTFYADRGLRSGTPRWGYPSHRYRGGPLLTFSRGRLRRSDVPCRPVMFGRRIFQCLAMPIWHWPEPNKLQMILRRIPMSLDKWDCISGTSQHGTSELFTSSGQRHLIFDPLDNRNPALRINYQRVSWLKESQEVSMKWGLGRSA